MPETGPLTVDHVLRLPVLSGSRLVAGEAGRNRTISCVDVMEVPDVVDWVRPGELLLTTAYALRDQPHLLAELIPKLTAKHVAGLAVKTGRYVQDLPIGMLKAADQLGFPLIELPHHVAYIDIVSAMMSIILGSEAQSLRESAQVRQRFAQAAIADRGLDGILAICGDLLDGSATVLGSDDEYYGAVDAVWRDALRELVSGSTPLLSVPIERWTRGGLRTTMVARGVESGCDELGTLIVWNLRRPFTLPDFDILEYAASVVGFELRQIQATREAEADQAGIFLNDLLSRQMTTTDAIAGYSRRWGWDPAAPRIPLVVELATSARHDPLDEALRAVRWAVPRAWSVEREGRLLVVAPLPITPDSPRVQVGLDWAQRINASLRTALPDCTVWIGLGRARQHPADLTDGYREALTALAVGRQLSVAGGVYDFDSLGIYRLFATSPDREDFDLFTRRELGPLLAYDAEHHTDLVHTLDAFLRNGRRVTRAASYLWVHPNTLKYRLEQIERLIGPFRDLPDKELALEVALRLNALISPGS